MYELGKIECTIQAEDDDGAIGNHSIFLFPSVEIPHAISFSIAYAGRVQAVCECACSTIALEFPFEDRTLVPAGDIWRVGQFILTDSDGEYLALAIPGIKGEILMGDGMTIDQTNPSVAALLDAWKIGIAGVVPQPAAAEVAAAYLQIRPSYRYVRKG